MTSKEQRRRTSTAEVSVPSVPDDVMAVSDDVMALSGSIAHFTKDLYDQLSIDKPDDNLFLSPFSIAMTLGMAYVGSRGNTARQIAAVLKLRPDEKNVHTVFGKVSDCFFSKNAHDQLNLANNLFVDQKVKLLEEFVDILQSSFKSETKTVNFLEDPDGSRTTINQWVEKETNSKIKQFIPSGVLTSGTVLVLVNAIYFKGNWQKTFQAAETTSRQFILNDSKTMSVDMMYQEGDFPLGYIAELDCQVLEMPYIQNDVSMFILLPTRPDGLAELENNLNPAIFQSVRSFVQPQTVDVYLPKFKLEQGAELKRTLSKLGIVDLFSEGSADLSGIDGKKYHHVSKVFHTACIEVNEEGTEAAAATGVFAEYDCPDNPIFKADHPFLFFIQHNRTGAVLFIGRFCKPDPTERS